VHHRFQPDDLFAEFGRQAMQLAAIDEDAARSISATTGTSGRSTSS